MCLYPTIIRNKKYVANKKNGGIVPTVYDARTLYVPIGCQECMECRKKKSREWQARMMEEIKTSKNGKYVTLTFSNESILELKNAVINASYIEEVKIMNQLQGMTEQAGRKAMERVRAKREGYELDNAIATIAMRRFNERWRKKTKKAVRHWMVTELGHNGTENIHLHGIIWTDESMEEIRDKWKYGFVWPKEEEEIRDNYVAEDTINYIIKYITKKDEDHQYYKSKILCSPGIGKEYINTRNAEGNRFKPEKTRETYTTRTGHEISLPIYWRNKIYTEREREKLWIEKLEKGIRWVNGKKIDISKSEEYYYRVLKYEQERNVKLGYGGNVVNWERKRYEEQRREMMVNQRIKNTGRSAPLSLGFGQGAE